MPGAFTGASALEIMSVVKNSNIIAHPLFFFSILTDIWVQMRLNGCQEKCLKV